MERFSNKELIKKVKTNTIIPDNYEELRNPIVENETDLSFRIHFMYNGITSEQWFPKSRTINIGSKFYVEKWLLNKVK